jgi:glutaredoxin 3
MLTKVLSLTQRKKMGSTAAQKLVRTYRLLMISKTWCPDCVYAKKVFQEVGAEPHVVELDKLEEGPELQKEFLELTGQNTVPNLFLDGAHLGTENDLKRIHESGELVEKLKAANLIIAPSATN